MKLSQPQARLVYWICLAIAIFTMCLVPAVILLTVFGVPIIGAILVGLVIGNVLFELAGGAALVARICGYQRKGGSGAVAVLIVVSLAFGGLGLIVDVFYWPRFVFGQITQGDWTGHMSYARKGSGWYDARRDIFFLRSGPEAIRRLIERMGLTEKKDFIKVATDEPSPSVLGENLLPHAPDISHWKGMRCFYRGEGEVSYQLIVNADETEAYFRRDTVPD